MNAPKKAEKKFSERMLGSPDDIARWANVATGGPFALTGQERFWRDIQPFLLERGYSLRPRYAPDWKPSWVGTRINPRYLEDGHVSVPTWVMDARRADGTVVAIKWIPDEPHTVNELNIVRFLSTDKLQANSRCHTLPLLDTFSHPTIPGGAFMVVRWLVPITYASPEYVNDVADMMLQTFEGLSFLHSHGIAHRDCTTRNIMVDIDTVLPGVRWHPQNPMYTMDYNYSPPMRPRCRSRARYYLIDMGISSRVDPDSPGPHLVVGTIGRDQTAPELSKIVPYDPFRLDVYLLGNYFLTRFVAEYENLEFLRPVLETMTRRAPSERPTIDEAYAALCYVLRKQPGRAFRWRLREADEPRGYARAMDTFSAARELYYWARVPIRGMRELRFGRPRPQAR